MQHPDWSYYANDLLCLQQGDALRVFKTEASRKANEVHGLIRSGSAALSDAWHSMLHCQVALHAKLECQHSEW